MSSNIRPRTSKPRGICKYYTLPRGCFAGQTCKFLHGDPEHDDSRSPKHLLTPYDESKRCKYYANGFCRHGDQCWFKHTTDDPRPVSCDAGQRNDDQQDEPCSICLEKPVTYGLLSGCSHIFCITCIRQWRDQKGQIEHGNSKKCPMCREPSKFITPSSLFWRHGHPEKERVTKTYKESMARVPCRYFQRSRQLDKIPLLCPFGKDCFYQHLNDDGTPHIFKDGVDVCMRQYYNAVRPVRSMFDDIMEFTTEFLPLTVNGIEVHDTSGIFSMQVTADMGTTGESRVPDIPNTGERSRRVNPFREDPHIRRQLSILREAMDSLESAVSVSNDSVARTLDMVRTLVQQNIQTDTEFSHPTEVAANDVEIPSTSDTQTQSTSSQILTDLQLPPSPQLQPSEPRIRDDDYYDMPGLQSVSNSSSSEAYLSDSDNESDDEISLLGRYLTAANRRFRITIDRAEGEGEDNVARMTHESEERGPEIVEETADADEPQVDVMEYEGLMPEDEASQLDGGRVTNPPFLTDGRGRVVWSSDREAGDLTNSEPRPSTETGEEPSLVTQSQIKCSGLERSPRTGEDEEEGSGGMLDEHSH